jgi:predicted dehydrogenase
VLPSNLHYEVGAAVLQSGRHLLLEKPMAISISDCDKLLAIAREKKKLLAVGHEMRVSALWGKVKQMIDAGDIGSPLHAIVELWRKPYRLGAEGWRYDINRVGNWILEEPIHFFDLARWYFQKIGDPVSVFAQASASRPASPVTATGASPRTAARKLSSSSRSGSPSSARSGMRSTNSSSAAGAAASTATATSPRRRQNSPSPRPRASERAAAAAVHRRIVRRGIELRIVVDLVPLSVPVAPDGVNRWW